jgi:hypothetical protein
MSFTRNFEIRRYAGTMVRDGSYKTPAGSSLVLGTIVESNSATPGELKAGVANTTRKGGVGVLWFEHIQYQGVDPNLVLYMDRDTAPAAVYAQIISGSGVKVVYKNTPAVTLVDGRTRAARTMFDPTSVALGGYLKWNGTTLVVGSAADATPAATDLMRVTKLDTTTAGSEIVEAVLLSSA